MADKAIAQRRSNFKDLVGHRFGKLLVLAIGEVRAFRCGQNVQFWECRCDCGTVKQIRRQHLTQLGGTRSCGKCSRHVDRVGHRYGRLRVERYLGRRPSGRHYKTWWLCKCDCGKIVDVTTSSLITGNTRSCGCLGDESRIFNSTTHGMARSLEYRAWATIRARCTNSMQSQWHNYGARGIKICDEWRDDFAAFFAHVGPRPSPKHSIDRIDNDGNYEPGNVRWATAVEQRRNQRQKTHCLNGHLFTPETTVIRKGGGRTYRRCRLCERGMAIRAMVKRDPFEVVRQFEAAIADYTGARFAVTTTSCTMALLLALAWFKRQRGLRVVEIPRRTYVGVGMSILNAGHGIAFRDQVWSGEYHLSDLPLWDSARRLTSGMFRPGQMQCLSFHWTKHLAIQQGGAILLDDAEAFDWLKRARFDGRREGVHPKDDTFDCLGWHCYMAGATAAEGLMRLSVLPKHNADLPNSDYSDLSLAPIFRGHYAKRIDQDDELRVMTFA